MSTKLDHSDQSKLTEHKWKLNIHYFAVSSRVNLSTCFVFLVVEKIEKHISE